MLAVYAIRPDFLAVWLEEFQDLSSDGVNGQHSPRISQTMTPSLIATTPPPTGRIVAGSQTDGGASHTLQPG
jgi:hypothetical protein